MHQRFVHPGDAVERRPDRRHDAGAIFEVESRREVAMSGGVERAEEISELGRGDRCLPRRRTRRTRRRTRPRHLLLRLVVGFFPRAFGLAILGGDGLAVRFHGALLGQRRKASARVAASSLHLARDDSEYWKLMKSA